MAIGVAGPVLGRLVRLTNLPWSIDADQLESVLRCPVVLMNDLEAHGWAVALSSPRDLVTLQKGRPRAGNRALIAAGTGLGEATLFWQDGTHVPSASEGGHTSFSPTSPDEVELLSYLLGRYSHVSWERLVSGTFGFRNLVDFLRASGRISLPQHISAESLDSRDVGPLVTDAATNGDEWAQVVMQWFVRLYGAEAGNLALKSMAVNGVYIAGGIAPKILSWLKDGEFVSAFANKGRFADFMRDIPIHVVTDEHAALRGAAHVAHRHAVSRGK
jgi:glucokinase